MMDIEEIKKWNMGKVMIEAKKEDLRLALHDKINYYERLISDLREIRKNIDIIKDEYDLAEQFDKFIKEFKDKHLEENDY
jgi:hypothetical protein